MFLLIVLITKRHKIHFMMTINRTSQSTFCCQGQLSSIEMAFSSLIFKRVHILQPEFLGLCAATSFVQMTKKQRSQTVQWHPSFFFIDGMTFSPGMS